MKAKTTTLWERIQKFPIDEPGAEYPFSARLAVEQGWTRTHTLEVIEEYRRFLWLCCNGSQASSPSPAVDEAWHLHLTYTRSYWQGLCRDTLGRELHHEPTRGGKAQKAHFRSLYAQTLERYEEAFGEAPPAHIWPAEESATKMPKAKPLVLASVGFLPLVLLSSMGGLGGFIICLLVMAAILAIFLLSGSGSDKVHKNTDGTQHTNSHYTGCTVFTGCSSGEASGHSHDAGGAGDAGGDSGCSSGCSSCGGGCGGCGS